MSIQNTEEGNYMNKILNISKYNKIEYENGIFEGKIDEFYVIGDIHGDFFTFKKCLESTGCIIFDDVIYSNYIKIKGDYLHVEDGCKYFILLIDVGQLV